MDNAKICNSYVIFYFIYFVWLIRCSFSFFGYSIRLFKIQADRILWQSTVMKTSPLFQELRGVVMRRRYQSNSRAICYRIKNYSEDLLAHSTSGSITKCASSIKPTSQVLTPVMLTLLTVKHYRAQSFSGRLCMMIFFFFTFLVWNMSVQMMLMGGGADVTIV
jgi:hypothetical protein